jgi:hypothetical protein
MGREESIGRPEGEGIAPEELFEPLDAELAARSLPFGRLEGRGMGREEEGMPREERGTRLEEVLERCKVPFEWEGDGGMRRAGLAARRLAPELIDN